ncbi:MAG: Ppx/GppA phosphatase family protein [Hyphomicrobium sp.]
MKDKCANPQAPNGAEGSIAGQPTPPFSAADEADTSARSTVSVSETTATSAPCALGHEEKNHNRLSSGSPVADFDRTAPRGSHAPTVNKLTPPSQTSASPGYRQPRHGHSNHVHDHSNGTVYGALDLGTNNCRLLLARPSRRGFRVVDAFSRIIRLGEGVANSGKLSEPAMSRTLDALKICAAKLDRHRVTRARFVATEACRIAQNGMEFIDRVRNLCGLEIEVLNPELEARLAVSGCSSLIDCSVDYVLVFDIGGGSSEIIWLDLTREGARRRGPGGRIAADSSIAAWTSLPVGVVTLAERFDGRNVTFDDFEAMVSAVSELLAPFEAHHRFAERLEGRGVHFLGTSGTVTTIAGILLNLPRYDRNKVDGCWLAVPDIFSVTQNLLAKSYAERIAEPCIGRERADLVLAGCAILEAVLRMWPAQRLRVADRGLREGILTTLMQEDGVWRQGRRRRRQRSN